MSKIIEKPVALKEINWTKVQKMAQDHLDNVENNEAREDDDHYIFEAVMTAVFGKNVWNWYNSQVKD